MPSTAYSRDAPGFISNAAKLKGYGARHSSWWDQSAVAGQGEVLLHVKAASSRSAGGLASVLHVPEATASLFSTQQAMERKAPFGVNLTRSLAIYQAAHKNGG